MPVSSIIFGVILTIVSLASISLLFKLIFGFAHLCAYISMLCHEMVVAVFIKLVGWETELIIIGRGNLLLKIKLFNIFIEFRALENISYPYGLTKIKKFKNNHIELKKIIIYSASICLRLIKTILLLYLALSLSSQAKNIAEESFLLISTYTILVSCVSSLLILEFYGFLLNLIQIKFRKSDIKTDVGQIFLAIFLVIKKQLEKVFR